MLEGLEADAREPKKGLWVDPRAASGLLFGLGVNNLISLSSLRHAHSSARCDVPISLNYPGPH